MKQAYLHRRHLLVTLVAALAVAAVGSGCSDDVDDSTYEPKPMAFHPIGSFASVQFDGGTAKASMKHGADGCIQALHVDAVSKDGKHKLAVTFTPQDAFGMKVSKAVWQPDGDTAYDVVGNNAGWLPLDAISDEEGKSGAVNKLLVAPRGKITLAQAKPGDKTTEFDLATIQFGGDLVSELDGAATCSRCDPKSANYDDCKAPHPTYRVRDFQGDSPWFNLEYDLNVFLGRPVVAILTQGW